MIKSNLVFTSFILKMSERINSPFALFSLKKSIASFILHSEISMPMVLHPIREKGSRLPPSPQPTSKMFMCRFISLNCDIYGTKYLLLVSASSLKYNLLFFLSILCHIYMIDNSDNICLVSSSFSLLPL